MAQRGRGRNQEPIHHASTANEMGAENLLKFHIRTKQRVTAAVLISCPTLTLSARLSYSPARTAGSVLLDSLRAASA